MDLLNLLKSRRSIRKFDSTKALSDELLDRIIEAGRLAPSAVNIQPWHFYLVKSEEGRKKIWECYDRDWAKEAQAYVLVTGKVEECWKYADGYGDTTLYTDCAIATTSMMLQAWSEGVGSVWICNFDRQKCCELFGLSMETERPLNILALGYPSVDPTTLPLKRKPMEEILTIL